MGAAREGTRREVNIRTSETIWIRVTDEARGDVTSSGSQIDTQKAPYRSGFGISFRGHGTFHWPLSFDATPRVLHAYEEHSKRLRELDARPPSL